MVPLAHPRPAQEVLLARQHRKHKIIAQCVMVIEVFVAQGNGVDALGQQLNHRVFYAVGIAIIGEALRHPRRQGDVPVDLTQQQTTRIRTDPPTIESTGYAPPAQRVKLQWF